MRYSVKDLPVRGLGAFTPLTNTNATASSWGTVVRTAAMGLLPIPVPRPESVWAPPISFDPHTQSSNCSPDVILPDQYIAYNRNMGPAADAGIGMAARRHAVLPVPATRINYSARSAMATPRIAGRRTMPWPRAFQRYPVR